MAMFSRRYVPAVVLACSALALAAEPTNEELKNQIDALQRKLEALEARQTSAADVDATVARVLKDAEARSQLMDAEGFTAGYNKGKFTLQSADGGFTFSPTAQLQFRYNETHVDGGDGEDDEFTDGFEVRRAKFGFAGNVVNKELTYKLQWATDRADGSVELEDAWVRYRLNQNFALFGGQFEDLTTHESLVSSSKQLAVEQSLANVILVDSISQYVQGAGVAYENGKLRASAAFTDGFNSGNTRYDQSPANWGASGRVEYLALGETWKPYDDFSAIGNKEDLLVFGGGASYQEGFANENAFLYGVDAQWEPNAVQGLALFAALMGNHVDADAGADDLDNYGWLVQAGYMLNARWEVFGRYDQVILDEADNDNIQEYTLGVNYYLNGHAAKFTADINYLPEGSAGQSGLGYIGTDETETVARVQFQLLL